MRTRFPPALVLALSFCVASCAGMRSSVPDSVVESWSQRPDERGQLPVGVVVSVEKVEYQSESEPIKPAIYSANSAVAIVALAPVVEYIRNANWYFRTAIQMKDGSTRSINVRYTLKKGACIAFRPGMSGEEPLAIPALPGECT